MPEIPNITAIIATYELSGNLKRITTTLSKKQVRKTYTIIKSSMPLSFYYYRTPCTDENGLTVIYVLAYTHSSTGSNPVEVLLDCSESIDCMDVFKIDQTQQFGEYSVSVGAMTPIGKTVQHSKTIGECYPLVVKHVYLVGSFVIFNYSPQE